MTKIYLIRHAEAEGNIFRRAHGQFNGQIIGRGFRQIEQLKKRFGNEKIDAVYSSDLSRAYVTASAIYEQHGLPLNAEKRLREVNMGVWEDTAWGNMEYNEPEMSWFFSNDPAKWHVSGSEDYTDVRKRMTECITEIAVRNDGGVVAVFSHGFAIRIFLCGILGVRSDEISEVPYCDNTAVNLLVFDNGKFSVEYRGDNSHLSDDLSTFAHQTWWRQGGELVRENLRFAPLDVIRDSALVELCRGELGERYGSREIHTALMMDEPVGLLGVDRLRETENDAGWADFIYIKPEFRRRNCGVQLLGQAVAVFRKLGREKLRGVVCRDTPAHEFCLKYGFELLKENESSCLVEKNIKNWY